MSILMSLVLTIKLLGTQTLLDHDYKRLTWKMSSYRESEFRKKIPFVIFSGYLHTDNKLRPK